MGKTLSTDKDMFQAGFSPSLKRLIINPKRLGSVSLWNALEPDERAAAAQAYLGAEERGREELNKTLAKARHFRPATVRKWPEEKIVKETRHVPLHDPMVASRLLTCHHVPGQLAMVTAFLDALGVSHDQGRVDASLASIDAEEDVVRSAIRAMVEEHGLRAAVVYLLALRFFGAPAGEMGRAWLHELFEVPPGAADAEAEESPETEPEAEERPAEDRQAEEEDPTR